jgi:hypothetical protein
MIDEVYRALGKKPPAWLRKFLDPLLFVPASRFSKIALEFDSHCAEGGFAHASCQILPNFIKGIRFAGLENVPKTGPLLVVSNHPGTVDSLCIAAGVDRKDIRIVASGVPFLRGLQSTARHLIYSSLDTYMRMMVVRSGIKHLKEGGALLIFPSGHIDPDPEMLPGAEEGLREWSPSVDLILHKVPQAQVLVTIVSGVLSQQSLHNPFTRLRKSSVDRQRIAEFVQISRQMILGLREELIPKVSFAPPLQVFELAAQTDGTELLPALIKQAQKLLAIHEMSSARILDRRWNFAKTL